MRTEINRIIALLERARHGKCWNGDNYETILAEIDPSKINLRINGFNNTIHQIERHFIATDNLILQRIKRNNVKLSAEENWTKQEELLNVNWADTLELKDRTYKSLLIKIEDFDDNWLDNPPFLGFSPWYVQFHRVIEHLHYHMAQIKLINLYQNRNDDYGGNWSHLNCCQFYKTQPSAKNLIRFSSN
jgi:uncharacterized damage-inducible protein DinB